MQEALDLIIGWRSSARSNRSNRLSGVDRPSHSNRCHTDRRTPCIFPVSGLFLYSWESGEADSIAPLLSSRSGFLRSRYRDENVGIRSWLPCPSYLVRNCVEVGICDCCAAAGSRQVCGDYKAADVEMTRDAGI